MNRQQVIETLDKLKPYLVKRYGVMRLVLFDSAVCDETSSGSDMEIIVSFNGPATSEKFFGVLFCLEDALGHPIDLVTEKAVRVELLPFIEQESINF